MKEKTGKIIHTVYGAVFGAYTAAVAALLIWQTVDTYRTGVQAGTQIFTRADVGERLKNLLPAFLVWIALCVVGYVLSLLFVTERRVHKQDIRYTLRRLKKRAGAAGTTLGEASALVRREETILRILWSVVGAVGVAGGVYTIVYLCNPAHFPKIDVTAEMAQMVKHVLPWVTWTFLWACGVGVYERFSAQKQLPEVKKLAAGGKAEKRESEFVRDLRRSAENGKFAALVLRVYEFLRRHGVWVVRAAVGCAAVAFVIAGVVNDGAHDVLIKAINICTECIGLG